MITEERTMITEQKNKRKQKKNPFRETLSKALEKIRKIKGENPMLPTRVAQEL